MARADVSDPNLQMSSTPAQRGGTIAVVPCTTGVCAADHGHLVRVGALLCVRQPVHISLYGPISLGSTRSLLSAYTLVTSLEAIGRWVRTTFCDSIRSWLLFNET